MESPSISVPPWFLAVVAGFLFTQLGAAVMWAIRSDRAAAVRDEVIKTLAKNIDGLIEQLKMHSLDVMRRDLDALTRDVEEKHKRLRDDLAQIQRDVDDARFNRTSHGKG